MTVSSPYAAALGRVPVREEAVAVLGSTTRYWDYGDRDATTTLVLVHGFRGDHHGLEPVVAQLDGIRMISPDLPGFGASTPMTEAAHDIVGYGRWLRAFVDGLGLTGRVVLLGHSFGSIVVSGALAGAGGGDGAAERPAGVVLVNPIGQPALEGPRGVFTRLAIFYYWLAAVLPERLGFALLRNRVIVRVMSMAMAKTKEPALRRWIHDQHDRYFSAFSDRQVVLEAFRASVSHDVSEYAGRIPERTLLVAAEKDDITPIAAEYRLQTLFPDAELVVIPDVGHLIHYETPAAAARAIQRFVAELPGERA